MPVTMMMMVMMMIMMMIMVKRMATRLNDEKHFLMESYRLRYSVVHLHVFIFYFINGQAD